MLGHGGDNSSEWRLRAQVVLLRHLAAERIKVDILLRLGAIQRGLIVLDKCAGNICAGAHVALVLGRQLDIFGQAAALGDRLGHGHGGHGGQSRSGGQILAGGRGRGKCVEVELMTRRAAHARADGHRRLGSAVPMKTSNRSLRLQHLRVPAALFKLPYPIPPSFSISPLFLFISSAMQAFRRPVQAALSAAGRRQAYSTASPYASTNVNLRINKDTKVLFQGFTGRQGTYVAVHSSSTNAMLIRPQFPRPAGHRVRYAGPAPIVADATR